MEYQSAAGALLVVQVVPEFVEVQMTPPTYAPAILVPSADEATDVKCKLNGWPLPPEGKKLGKVFVFHVTPPLVEIKIIPEG